MKDLRSYLVIESVKSMASEIEARMSSKGTSWSEEDLMSNYGMTRLDLSVSTADPKCLRVVAKPASKLRKNLDGWARLIKDVKEVAKNMGLVACIEDQKMPKAQADICKDLGFTYQHGSKTRYELPTLTEFYLFP